MVSCGGGEFSTEGWGGAGQVEPDSSGAEATEQARIAQHGRAQFRTSRQDRH